MNKEVFDKDLEMAVGLINEALCIIEKLKEQQQEDNDNYPINLREYEEYEEMEQRLTILTRADYNLNIVQYSIQALKVEEEERE